MRDHKSERCPISNPSCKQGTFGVVIMMVRGEAFEERHKMDEGRVVDQEEAKKG